MLIRQLRSYLHEVAASAGIPGRIVPHQLRHTYASELLRCGVDFPALMKLLGHASPEMTMVYLDIALTDLQRQSELARSQSRHIAPPPRTPLSPTRAGFAGLIDSLLTAQHVVEMYRPTLPDGPRVAHWIASLIGSPRFSPKSGNLNHPQNRQRLASYVGLASPCQHQDLGLPPRGS